MPFLLGFSAVSIYGRHVHVVSVRLRKRDRACASGFLYRIRAQKMGGGV